MVKYTIFSFPVASTFTPPKGKAEGVEKEEELKVLKFLGCDIIQGYYFSKPLDPQTFEKYLKNFNEN